MAYLKLIAMVSLLSVLMVILIVVFVYILSVAKNKFFKKTTRELKNF